MRGPSPAAASGGHSSSRCADLSLSWPLLLRSTGSRRTGPAIVAHGPSRSAACGILPDQGSNPCPPHWQADSTTEPPGKPYFLFLKILPKLHIFFTFSHFFSPPFLAKVLKKANSLCLLFHLMFSSQPSLIGFQPSPP